MKRSLSEWMKSGMYLPPRLRDFHDQKDVFKAVHELVERDQENKGASSYVQGLDFVKAQVYTIDFFLWYMARRGYTLQRSRMRLDFNSLDDDVSETKARRRKEMAEALGLTRAEPTP